MMHFKRTVPIFLLLVLLMGVLKAQNPLDRENYRRLDQGVAAFESGNFVVAETHFKYVLDNMRVLPNKISYYFGANSFYLGNYKQSINWLNKYIELEGATGLYYQDAVQVLRRAEEKYNEITREQARETAAILGEASSTPPCDTGDQVRCPICLGETVIIEEGPLGNIYRTCPYSDEKGMMSCEDFILYRQGKLHEKYNQPEG